MSGAISGIASNIDWGDLLSVGATIYGNNALRSNAPNIPYTDFRTALDTVNPNRRFSTGRSTMAGGNVNFDPSIRTTQNQALANAQTMFGDLKGNMNPFMMAKVNPLREAYALRRGELKRDLGRRGVFGSFANQDMTNLDTTANREIGDARAIATQQTLDARRGVNQDIANISQQKFQQELSGLGLAAESISQLMKIAFGISDSSQTGALYSARLEDAANAGRLELLGRGLNSLSGNPFDSATSVADTVSGLSNAGGGNPLAAAGQISSETASGSGGFGDMMAGPRTSARMPTGNALTGAGLTGAQTALGTEVGSGMYMGADGLVTDLTGMAATEGTGSSAAAGMGLNPASWGAAGLAAPLAMIGITKAIVSLSKMAKGGSVESAKMGKLSEQLQRDNASDPTGATALKTIDKLLTGGLWKGEGNQWVVDELFKSGVIDVNHPTLYAKNSIISLDMKPGHNTEASTRIFSQIAKIPKADAEKLAAYNRGVAMAKRMPAGEEGSLREKQTAQRLGMSTAEYEKTVARYMPTAIRNATALRQNILSANPRADVSKLDQFIRSAA